MSRPTGYVWTPGNRADQAIYLRHLLSAVEDERIQLTLDEREAGPAYKPEFEGNPDEEHF